MEWESDVKVKSTIEKNYSLQSLEEKTEEGPNN